jgi:hypothetical protein
MFTEEHFLESLKLRWDDDDNIILVNTLRRHTCDFFGLRLRHGDSLGFLESAEAHNREDLKHLAQKRPAICPLGLA